MAAQQQSKACRLMFWLLHPAEAGDLCNGLPCSLLLIVLVLLLLLVYLSLLLDN
jgi:hypothetical protein